MIYSLRDYQQTCVDTVRGAFLQGYLGVIMGSPTGSGKTVMFSHMAREAIAKGNKVMIVCNRKELIKQSYEKLTAYGLRPTILAPGYPNIPSNCYVSSVDTLMRRGIFPQVDFVIIDECHIAKFDKLAQLYMDRGVYVLGATATPIRKGQQLSLHRVYDKLVSTLQVSELISDGHLVPNITYGADVDLTTLQNNKLEYDRNQLFGFYNRSTMYNGVFDKWKQFAQEGPTIAFNVTRDASKAFVEQAKSRGIPAVHVDGSMSDFQRNRLFREFESSRGDYILSNCQVATTGYDFPGLRNIICYFTTKSLTKWLQVNGRGARTDVDTGKTHFVTIDMGSNVSGNKHGFWDDDRQWDLVKTTKKSQGASPSKECPNCLALIHASVQACPHCGM